MPLAKLITSWFTSRIGAKPIRKAASLCPSVGELELRELLSTTSLGVPNWGTSFFAPYVNVEQNQPDGTRLNYLQAAQQAHATYLALGFIDMDSNGMLSWQGDSGAELGTSLDQYIQNQVDLVRAHGGDVMISFGGEDDASTSSTEIAHYVVSTLGTGTAAVNKLVGDYQQVIDEYHLTHMDFDIEGDAESDTAAINLRSQALAQLQRNDPGLKVQFTLSGDIPQDANLVFGMDAGAQAVVNAALSAGVNIDNVNLMTMDFSIWVNYYDNTAANRQLYNVQLNPGGFSYAGDDAAEQGIQNVADVVERNATAEFSQLQHMFQSHALAKTDTQIWAMVGMTPEIGRNFTDESAQGEAGNSNVIFSIQDAQTITAFAQQHDIGRISMWSLNRDQAGNPSDPVHYETNSSLDQTPYQFSQIFSAVAHGTSHVAAPTSTTIHLTSDHPAGAVHGQAVKVTATVAAADTTAGVPTGTVQFFVDGVKSGSPVKLSGGLAKISLILAAGNHKVTAAYTSNATVFVSAKTATSLAQIVKPAPLTITTSHSVKGRGLTVALKGVIVIHDTDTIAQLTVRLISSLGKFHIKAAGGTIKGNGTGTLILTGHPAAMKTALNVLTLQLWKLHLRGAITLSVSDGSQTRRATILVS